MVERSSFLSQMRVRTSLVGDDSHFRQIVHVFDANRVEVHVSVKQIFKAQGYPF